MKRIIIILSILLPLTPCSLSQVLAQQGLRINDVFEGKVVPTGALKESLVKGESLSQYKLQVLHTVKFQASYEERDKAEALFEEDMKQGLGDNMEMERRGGHLYYAIVQIDDAGSLHRYICYQCQKKQGSLDITLVYMEGRATLADLRKSFKKK